MSSLKHMDKMKLKEDQELVQHLVHTVTEQTLEPNFLISGLLSFCSVKDKGRVGLDDSASPLAGGEPDTPSNWRMAWEELVAFAHSGLQDYILSGGSFDHTFPPRSLGSGGHSKGAWALKSSKKQTWDSNLILPCHSMLARG